jgi:hypothetical protein
MFRGSRGTDPVDWASVLSHGEPPLIPPLTLKTAAASRVPLHQESLIQLSRRSHRAGCGTCSFAVLLWMQRLDAAAGCSGWMQRLDAAAGCSGDQEAPCRRCLIALARLAGLPQLVGAAWAKAGSTCRDKPFLEADTWSGEYAGTFLSVQHPIAIQVERRKWTFRSSSIVG